MLANPLPFYQAPNHIYCNRPFQPYNSQPMLASLPFSQTNFANIGKPYDLMLIPESPISIGKPICLYIQLYNQQTRLPPSQLQIMHEKPAHVFIVSQDLSDFQHLHPDVMSPGLLRLPIQFNKPGQHKLFIQFKTPEEGEQTLNKPFLLGSVQQSQTLLRPDAHEPKYIDGYKFQVKGLPTQTGSMSMFHIEISQNGVPVANIEPFLGAGAHGVIISQDTQSFVHTHPTSKPVNGLYHSPIMFHTQIDKPGLYKMWIQTQINGQLHTVDWTFPVYPSLPGGSLTKTDSLH
jgi:hypothetical protein